MPTSTRLLHCRSFSLARRGHEAGDCQDAHAFDLERGRIAIADGAAESAHCGLWARLLVEAFVQHADDTPWPEWIAPLQQRWAEAVAPLANDPLPWYLEDRMRQGAFSTFLGLRIEPGHWHALAVGDSCLFAMRGDAPALSFPLTRAAQFDSTPWLVGSRASLHEVPARQHLRAQGDWLPGDRIWLMTDALSRWFLSECEAGHRPWLHLHDLLHESDDFFVEWIGRLRAARLLRNDDTTLVGVW